MIFVSLGSQKFQFDRLLKKIDELIEQDMIQDKVVAQIGASTYIPKHYEYVNFMDRTEFAGRTEECDLFITHGGTGAIIGAVKKGKKVVAVPRLAEYGEHVDNHQLQLLGQFDEMGIIEVCYELDKLDKAVEAARQKTYRSYVSNTGRIVESIDEYIEGL